MNYCKGWDDMKYDERKERMISLLDAHETLSIQQLVELLGISPATVRRDVVRMEEEGEIERYWGGIKRRLTPENMRKNTLQSKISDTSYAALGQYAAEQLSDNELIFIGSGTTTLAMIPYPEPEYSCDYKWDSATGGSSQKEHSGSSSVRVF